MYRPAKLHARSLALTLVAITLVALLTRGCTNNNNNPTTTTSVSQKSFASPEEALTAVIAAIRNHDTDQLEQIFGPDSDDIISSGDPVDDQATENRVLAAYDEKHQLITNDDGSVTVTLGNNDWPMPIPIVKDDSGNRWIYDTEDGKQEIINRRIGRNELDVIEVCQAVCDAQREYAQRDPNNDGIPEYARKFVSDAGTKDGLYWPTAEGETPSPLGSLAAEAQGAGYKVTPNETSEPRPFHGYFFRIITKQGKDAPGGAQDYEVNGKLLGGFAVVAWPADYGSSGIMTFVTNYTGDVYQKDLGDDTDKIARAMTEYTPDSSWKKQESQEQEQEAPTTQP
jgi:hypothetical protein